MKKSIQELKEVFSRGKYPNGNDYSNIFDSFVHKDDEVETHEYSIVSDDNTGEYSAVYHLTKDGVNEGVPINIPKDMVVQSGSVKACETENVPVQGYKVGDKYIDLILANSEDNHIYILLSDIIDKKDLTFIPQISDLSNYQCTVGTIVQYSGETTSELTKGYFYKKTEGNGELKQNIVVTSIAEVNDEEGIYENNASDFVSVGMKLIKTGRTYSIADLYGYSFSAGDDMFEYRCGNTNKTLYTLWTEDIIDRDKDDPFVVNSTGTIETGPQTTYPTCNFGYSVEYIESKIWNEIEVQSSIELDDEVTEESSNGVKSSGIYNALKEKQDDISGNGSNSSKLGLGTIANSNYQTAIGRYNIADNNGQYAFVVGNGTSDTNRSNAATIDWDGNINAKKVNAENIVENLNGISGIKKVDSISEVTESNVLYVIFDADEETEDTTAEVVE